MFVGGLCGYEGSKDCRKKFEVSRLIFLEWLFCFKSLGILCFYVYVNNVWLIIS